MQGARRPSVRVASSLGEALAQGVFFRLIESQRHSSRLAGDDVIQRRSHGVPSTVATCEPKRSGDSQRQAARRANEERQTDCHRQPAG
jgi:hypothetical protein